MPSSILLPSPIIFEEPPVALQAIELKQTLASLVSAIYLLSNFLVPIVFSLHHHNHGTNILLYRKNFKVRIREQEVLQYANSRMCRS